MGSKSRPPVTPAIRALRAADAEFDMHLYRYVERGGTAASSEALGVDERQVIKTLVLEDQDGAPLVMLMHGDREVATGLLARQIGAKKVTPCDPATAEKHSGYQVGGTSPFGLRNPLPIYAEATIRDLETIWINGGKRGFLVSMSPEELSRIAKPVWVEASC